LHVNLFGVNTKDTFNIIANPNAGRRGRIERAIAQSIEAFDARGIPHTLQYAYTPELAREIAGKLEHSGEKFIVVIGGDGTISEVVNGLVDPSKVAIGLIPAGTGNDLAKTIKINKNPKRALEHIFSGIVKQFDYIQGATRRAVNTVSTGIDIEIIGRYNACKRRNKFNYYRALLTTVFRYKYSDHKIKTDVAELGDSKYFVIAACNGQYFGGGMRVSPNSCARDGKINLVAINQMSRPKVLFRLVKFLTGKHIGKPYTIEHLTKTVKLNNAEPTTVDYDGELVQNEPFDLKVVTGGLNILYDEALIK
jgi:YegS/Rv2252/BmrU family lipid kinase